MSETILVQSSPSPSPSVIQAPASDPLATAGAIIAIVFAIAAGILGYRILRGGKGL